MKDHYVNSLNPNDKITSFFLVQSKEVRYKKTSGEPYLALQLSDRTGRIDAKMWDNVEPVMDAFERDDFIKVRANVQLYREQPQLIVSKIRKAEDDEVDMADFVPHTDRAIDMMWAELRGAVEAFQNADLKRLVLAFLDDAEIAEKLQVAPAAKTLHHAKIGGLLEHVCSLMNLARLVASNYDFVDVELVQTGVVLHDIGKIHELTYDRSFGYSDDGQLLGHITICLQMIDRKARELDDFPPKLKRLVEHLVLSHHGKYEFGSPKLPMFPEALMLSYIDDLDSKLESMRASIAADKTADQRWTRYNPSLERPLLDVEAFLKEEADEEPQPAPAADPPPLPNSSHPTLFGEKLQGALGDDSKA